MEANSADGKEMITLKEKVDHDKTMDTSHLKQSGWVPPMVLPNYKETKVVTPSSNHGFPFFHNHVQAPENAESDSSLTSQNCSTMSSGAGFIRTTPSSHIVSNHKYSEKSRFMREKLNSTFIEKTGNEQLSSAAASHFLSTASTAASTTSFCNPNISHADTPRAQLLQGVPKKLNVGDTPQNVPESSCADIKLSYQGSQYGKDASNILSYPKEKSEDAGLIHTTRTKLRFREEMVSDMNFQDMEKIYQLGVEIEILKESYEREQTEVDHYLLQSEKVMYPSEYTANRIEKLKIIPRTLDERLKALKVRKIMLPQECQRILIYQWEALENQEKHMVNSFRELERRCTPHLASESSKEYLKLISLPELKVNQWSTPSLYEAIQLWLSHMEANHYLATTARKFYVDKILDSLSDQEVKADILQTVNPTNVQDIVVYLVKNCGQPAVIQRQLIEKHNEIGRIESPIHGRNAEENFNKIKIHLALMRSGLALIQYFDHTYGVTASSIYLQDGVLTQWYMHTLGNVLPVYQSAEFIVSLVKLTAREKFAAFHNKFLKIQEQCFHSTLTVYN